MYFKNDFAQMHSNLGHAKLKVKNEKTKRMHQNQPSKAISFSIWASTSSIPSLTMQ